MQSSVEHQVHVGAAKQARQASLNHFNSVKVFENNEIRAVGEP
jgi:hypothetical protein